MVNPMDKIPFATSTSTVQSQANALQTVFQQALQNPKVFEEQFKQMNPQAYQRACSIRNAYMNGGIDMRSAIMQMAQARGINPNMLGLK